MIELFFLLCVAIIASTAFLSLRKKKQSQFANRYRKTKKSIRTQLIRSAKSYSTMRSQKSAGDHEITANDCEISLQTPEQDSDSVLGLNKRSINTTPKKSTEETTAHYTKSSESCIVVLYLMAPENCVYGGYELLQSLLSSGLRYGKKRIFHRHTHKDGRGDILFHCASATEPGTFDLTKMGSFTSKGLCLFFSADTAEEPMAAFDCLLETLDQLVEDLGGEVLDDRRKLLTKEKMFAYRQKIRAMTNNRSMVDLFQNS